VEQLVRRLRSAEEQLENAMLRDAPVVELHIAPEGGPAAGGAGAYLLDAATDAPARPSACE
jgi:hypothetical protein